MHLVLASSSPRRRDLLKHFGLGFTVHVVPTEELEEGDPRSVAEYNARAKALAVSVTCKESLVLAADTIVVLAGKLLGKPENPQVARKMLRTLSAREHEVITVVVLACQGQAVSMFSEVTRVRFRQLTDFEIEGYIATGEPLDKAGAYGIQGFGGLLVQSIKGCYYNVVGLPMPRLVVELRRLGLETFPKG